jgi:hypothetical protein
MKNDGDRQVPSSNWRATWRRRLKFCLGPFVIMCLLGAGPSPEGGIVSSGLGYRARTYTIRACDSGGSDRHVHNGEAVLAAAIKYRSPDIGFTAAAESEGVLATKLSGDGGDHAGYGHLSGRLGFQGKYAGIELGGVGGSNAILPAGELWLGPHEVYLWGTVLSDASFHSYSMYKVGLGHFGDAYRVNVGVSFYPVPGNPREEPDQSVLVMGDFQKNISGPAWLGASFEAGNLENWAGIIKFSWQFGGTQQADAKQPPGPGRSEP